MKTISELINLRGRQTLITGGTGAIGRVIADTVAELGSDVILLDRPGSDFESLQKELHDRWKVKVLFKACDLEDGEQRQEILVWLKQDVDTLDILVNNAAFVGESNLEGWVTSFEKQSVETWKRALEVNLTAVFELTQGCVPLMKGGFGSIINISSIYGLSGPDLRLYEGTKMGNPAAYAASKGGMLQLSRWLATTLAPAIRVNSISPGGVYRNQPDVFVQRYIERTPMGRMATEEDFKGAIAYLASDLSAYFTGQNLIVDGGWTAW